jgi:hypothetical protein
MKLTEKRAIKLSIELWQWLYDNPTLSKEHWPKNAVYDLENMKGQCFCCEYYVEYPYMKCSARDNGTLFKCPLMSLLLCGTAYPISAYVQWMKATFIGDIEYSKKNSLTILNALKKKYAKISK